MSPPTFDKKIIFGLCLGIIAVLIYGQGIGGDFIFDDIGNIVQIRALHINELSIESLKEAWSSGIAGPTGRPIAVLSFALNHYFFGGLNPDSFKWVNIALHVVNAALIWRLLGLLVKGSGLSSYRSVRTQLSNPYLPFLAAAIWLIHPLHISSTLYVVQRMNLLATLFSLLSIIFYLRFRLATTSSIPVQIASISGMLISLIAGIYSKENAALTIYLIALIEICIFGFNAGNATKKKLVALCIFLLVALPTLCLILYSLISPNWFLGGYADREFSLIERLLTQGRLLWVYAQWILIPKLSDFGFHHDDILISESLLSPWTTFTSITALSALILLCAIFRRKLGLISFGIFFFLTGHLMESSILALEMAFEHRNYLPSLGLILAALVSFNWILQRLIKHPTLPIQALTSVLIICLLCAMTLGRASKWSDPISSASMDVSNHPNSARSHHSYALALANKTNAHQNYELISHHYEQASRLDINSISGLYGQILLDVQVGRPVAEKVLEEFNHRISTIQPRTENLYLTDHLISVCAAQNCEPWMSHQQITGFTLSALKNPYISGAKKRDYQILHAKCLIAFERKYGDARELLAEILEKSPMNMAANSLFLELELLGKPLEQQIALIEKFAETEVGQRHPSLVRHFLDIFEKR